MTRLACRHCGLPWPGDESLTPAGLIRSAISKLFAANAGRVR